MKYRNQQLKYGAADPPANRIETQAAIGCGQTKFWELLAAGEFPNAFKVGREVRVPWEDIEAFKARHRIQHPSDAE